MYGLSYRPATIERLAIGTDVGKMLAITHEAIGATSQYEDFFRNDTGWSGKLYASPNARYVHKLARIDEVRTSKCCCYANKPLVSRCCLRGSRCLSC